MAGSAYPCPAATVGGDHRWLSSPAIRREILKVFAEQSGRSSSRGLLVWSCTSPRAVVFGTGWLEVTVPKVCRSWKGGCLWRGLWWLCDPDWLITPLSAEEEGRCRKSSSGDQGAWSSCWHGVGNCMWCPHLGKELPSEGSVRLGLHGGRRVGSACWGTLREAESPPERRAFPMVTPGSCRAHGRGEGRNAGGLQQ